MCFDLLDFVLEVSLLLFLFPPWTVRLPLPPLPSSTNMAMRPSFLRRASTTEVYTALRLPLVDKSRGTESTTAAALINAALAHSEGISAHQEPGGDHTVLIHRRK